MAKKAPSVEEDTKAGKFSVECPKKLYKGGFVEGLFPFRKALLDKFTAKGVEFSLPEMCGATAGKKGEGFTELKCGTKTAQIKPDDKSNHPVLLCNPQITYSDKDCSVACLQKAPGKIDVVYKTDVNLKPLPAAKGMLKLEDRKDGRDLVCGLNFTDLMGKKGMKADVKLHPLRMMEENKTDSADLKASLLYPVSDMLKVACEFKSDLAPAPVKPKASVALAMSMKGLTGGLYFRSDAGNQLVGANAHKKIEVAGKTVETAVELFSPLSSLGSFSWLAGCGTNLNKQTTLNAKLNNKMQLNLALKHQPHSSFTVQVGTLMQVDNMGGMPNVGFKVTMKA